MLDIVEFGRRLREERKRLGLTQEELGARTGVRRATQATYEAGKTPPDVTYMSLASDLNVDVHYLLSGRRSAVATQDFFDWDMAEALFRAVEERASSESISIPPHKLFKLVRLLYPSAAHHRRVDPQQVTSAVQLLA